jgi:Ca2+-transporting ATPase
MTTLHSGLSDTQAAQLFEQFGPNTLPAQPPPSPFSILLTQFKSPLVYVLLAAGAVTLFLQHYSDALVIFLAVAINTVLGFFQETKANRAFAALNAFVVQTCTVVRDNHRQELATTHLVPGDVVLLSPGGKVPADGVILAANRLNVDEAIMTGESSAVTKKINDQLYMGTTIQTGQATLLVTQTGSQTKIGSIAQEIQTREPATPLQQQLQVFSKNLVILILLLTSCIFLIGLFKGEAPIEMLSTSVALAVSSIPEGLVISLTVVLAIGMQKILRRRGLVRKLSSAETLGGITTICLDKTGTLTEGKMQVVEYLGDQEELATQMLLANDLDDPIVIAAYDWALQVMGDNPVQSLALDNIPFSPKERFSLTLHQLNKSENIIYVNGAPDILLRACKLSQIEKKKDYPKN